MFTGLIQTLGEITAVAHGTESEGATRSDGQERAGARKEASKADTALSALHGDGKEARAGSNTTKDVVFTIKPSTANFPLVMGASIACHGICLTVTSIADDGSFTVAASEETLARTNAGNWQVGTRINLEPSLRVGDRLGGHFVSGHVDGLGSVRSITPAGDSAHWVFNAPAELMPMIAVKGSIAIDGVSLTVNTVDAEGFGATIIQHTNEHTHFGGLKVGEPVHLEVDMLARYVARAMEAAA